MLRTKRKAIHFFMAKYRTRNIIGLLAEPMPPIHFRYMFGYSSATTRQTFWRGIRGQQADLPLRWDAPDQIGPPRFSDP
jgi:hypothetical protein